MFSFQQSAFSAQFFAIRSSALAKLIANGLTPPLRAACAGRSSGVTNPFSLCWIWLPRSRVVLNSGDQRQPDCDISNPPNQVYHSIFEFPGVGQENYGIAGENLSAQNGLARSVAH
jgi:hypothetical protein